MAKDFPSLTEEHIDFIRQQKIFFTASAPDSFERDFVNVSPKGYEVFHVFGPNRVGYLDYPGSGNATARHIGQNGRFTIMFCAFEGEPMIMRLYGKGKVIKRKDPEFAQYSQYFENQQYDKPRFGPWLRQLVLMDVELVRSSCGEAVPFFDYKGEREILHDWAEGKRKENTLDTYIDEHQ